MEKIWFIYSNDVVSGPYTTQELKSDIILGKWLADAEVWWKGQEEWLAIDKWYLNLDTIEEAHRQKTSPKPQVQRRNYKRASIIGTINVQKQDQNLELSLTSISGGGVGIRKGETLIRGELVNIEIESPLMAMPIRASAKVAYVHETGHAGLQFQKLHNESKATLMDYVKQFTDDRDFSVEQSVLRRAV